MICCHSLPAVVGKTIDIIGASGYSHWGIGFLSCCWFLYRIIIRGFLRSKVASHAKPSMARVKGPSLSLFIPHTWLKALAVNRHNRVLGMGPFHFAFLFPFICLPGRVQDGKPITREPFLSPWAPPTFGFACKPWPKGGQPKP